MKWQRKSHEKAWFTFIGKAAIDALREYFEKERGWPKPLAQSEKVSRIAFSLILIAVSFLGPFYASRVPVMPAIVTVREIIPTSRFSTTSVNAYSIQRITTTITVTYTQQAGERGDRQALLMFTMTFMSTQSYQTYSVVSETFSVMRPVETTQKKTFAESYPMMSIALSVGIGALAVLFLLRTPLTSSLRQAHNILNRRVAVWRRWIFRLLRSLERFVH